MNADQSVKTASAAKIPPPEIIYVDQHRVACDGGGGALGHPKVWYSLEDGEAECGYCGRRFVYAPERVK